MKIDKKLMTAIGVFAVIGVTGLAIMYRREIIQFVTGTNRLRRKAIAQANEEYSKWNVNGVKIKEHDPKTVSRLKDYWAATGNTYESMKQSPWSAAFISYLMKEAGAKDDFKYATSHSTYVVQAIKNRLNNKGRFKGYKPEEVKIEVGDLVCYPRSGSGANYNSTGSYESHCDIVTSINKRTGIATAVGGNVSDSVSKTIIPLDTKGKIDKTKTNKGYFVVIKY